MITIRRRDNGDELFSCDVDNIKDAVEQAVKMGIILFRADLSGANFSGANLRYTNLRYTNLRGANLRGANLSGADLWGANLWAANLSGANLRGTNLRIADLRGADLSGADLRDADLSGADLRDADIWGADLRYTNLMDADLRGVYLEGAKSIFRAGQSKDGYDFYAINGRDGVMIKAGRRWFTIEEARKHWAETRGGTELGEEMLRLVDEIEARAKSLRWL